MVVSKKLNTFTTTYKFQSAFRVREGRTYISYGEDAEDEFTFGDFTLRFMSELSGHTSEGYWIERCGFIKRQHVSR